MRDVFLNMKYLPHYTFVFSILLLSGVVFSVPSVQADGPVFVDVGATYPKFSTYPTVRQTALKDGDAAYLTAIIDNEATMAEVYVDLTAFGGDAHTLLNDVYDYYDPAISSNLIRQYQSDFFTVQSNSTTAVVPVTIVAVDTNGSTTESTISITLDNTAPVFTVSSVIASSSAPLMHLSELLLNGSNEGTGSSLTLLNIYEQEIGEDGETVLYQSVYDKFSAAAPSMFVLPNGSFTEVPVKLYTATAAEDLPSDVYFIKFLFHLRDQADNKLTASTSLISVANPPVASVPEVATTTEEIATSTEEVATTTDDGVDDTATTTPEITTTTSGGGSGDGTPSHTVSENASMGPKPAEPVVVAEPAPVVVIPSVVAVAPPPIVTPPKRTVAASLNTAVTPTKPKVVAPVEPAVYERAPVVLSPTTVVQEAPSLRPAPVQNQTASVYDSLNPDFVALLEALEDFFASQPLGTMLLMLAGALVAIAGIAFSSLTLFRPRTVT